MLYYIQHTTPGRLTLHDGTQGLMQKDSSDLFFPAASANRETALVVDSISFLLLRHSPSTLCRWLTSANHTHTLCLLHSDLHEGRVISQLDYVATSSLEVAAPLKVATSGYAGKVHTTHRKPSGKIVRQVQILITLVFEDTFSLYYRPKVISYLRTVCC